MSTCLWRGTEHPRVLKGRHAETCPEKSPPSDWHPPLAWPTCPGCVPCPHRHCAVCGLEHVDQRTCTACLKEARENVAEVARLDMQLLTEAIQRGYEQGVDSEAAMLEGAVAWPAAWRQRRTYGYRDYSERDRKGNLVWPDRLGEKAPLWVLGTWDMLVTEHLGHRRTRRVTVPSAAKYLDANLSELAQDDDFAFEDLARGVRECLAHLEAVLHDGEQIDAGAPCMACGAELVQPAALPKTCSHDTPARVWLKVLTSYPELQVFAHEHAAAREACSACDQGGRRDHWECPRCHKKSTDVQYRFAVKHLHREEATHLTDRDMEIRTGVKAGTVRSWARNGTVARKVDAGRTLYAVADVLRIANDKGMISA